MKKSFYIFLVILAVSCILCSKVEASTVETVDITIGAKVWYNWWEPPWQDGDMFLVPLFPYLKGLIPLSIPFPINNFDTDPAFMYGPVLSITFLNRWNIASVFMYGKFKSISEGKILEKSALHLLHVISSFDIIDSEYSRDITKYDSDTTVSCSVHNYVKLFAGFKYQEYSYEEKALYIAYADALSMLIGNYLESESDFKNYGPAIGIALTIPLYKGLFILYNISGGILFGSASYDIKKQAFINPNYPIYSQFLNEKFYSYSGNTALSLAYYIKPANLTIVAEGRYQVIFYQHERNLQGFLDLNGKYDHFYGVSFTAVYSFKIGGL